MRRIAAIAMGLAAAAACADRSPSAGITQGGVVDLALAREVVRGGEVPPMGMIAEEGLLSEHTLAIDAPECPWAVCPRVGTALAQGPDGSEQILIQVGFDTAHALQPYDRPPVDVVIVVDESSSMCGEAIGRAQEATAAILRNLGEQDRGAVVTFSHEAEVLLPVGPLGDIDTDAVADSLACGGGSNLGGGIEAAISSLGPPDGRARRMMLITDARPNPGSGPQALRRMVEAAAEAQIATTVLGAGSELGWELATALGRAPGGMALTLTPEHLATTLEEGLDRVLVPLAYDVEVALQPAPGWELKETVGGTTADDQLGEGVDLGFTTLFPSHRSGGGALLIAPPGAIPGHRPLRLGRLQVSFRHRPGSSIERHILDVTFTGTALDDGVTAADDPGPYKMGALISELRALRAAAQACAGMTNTASALARIDAAADDLGRTADELDDLDLAGEVLLMWDLRDALAAGRCAEP